MPTPVPLPPKPIPNRLQDHVSIVTGAAGFIGFETCHRFLEEGSRVVMVDIDDAKLTTARESLLSVMPDLSSFILIITADVTAEGDVQRFVEETVQHFGRLDSVFLCAGLSYSSTPVLETSVDLYDKIMDINCRSCKCKITLNRL